MAFMKDSPEMRLNSLSLYCSTQNEWHYSEAGETEKAQVLDFERDADWIGQSLWQPV